MDLKKLATSLTICLSAGGVGSLFTFQSLNTWYSTLIKPGFTPPNWMFEPIWTILYIMMGISLYIIWNKPMVKKSKRLPYFLFSIQLALNSAWSAFFFGLRSIVGGLIIISCLWLAILGTIYKFHKISRTAAWLLAPYLAWVTFACALNYVIWKLNR